MAARCANAQFVVVGSAPPAYRTYEDEIRARTRQYGLTARVSFLPFQGDLGDIMHAVDVVVVPSTEPESFGLVAVEAMAAGKPVVASAHGGSLETIVHGSNGLLVQPGDGGELARVMERLASSPSERCRLGQYGRQHYSERFGIGRYVDNFEALYSEIAR